jgi:ribosomal protein L11 methyltransferase
VKTYPALDVRSADADDLLYAQIDDFAPTAIEERHDGLRVFFASASARDGALAALSTRFNPSSIDVPDEDWARRSQANLLSVTVGRVVVSTPWAAADAARAADATTLIVVIQPSMGFGTGHHASTRLCLAAMQATDLTGKSVLDIGTGSGVLAIAARRLGALRSVGVDNDPDAVRSARENLTLNPAVDGVSIEMADLAAMSAPAADVVIANLSGAVLARSASTILSAAAAGGIVMLSGIMSDERDDVVGAFAPGAVIWERTEGEWVGLTVKKH